MASVIGAMMYYARKTDTIPNILFQIGGYVDLNRNKIIDTALKNKASHVMFIDADMTFPEDGILKLLNQKKPIIGGNYNVRLDPYSKSGTGPVTKMKVDNEVVSMLAKDFPTEPFQCYAIATGFMLIDLSILKKMDKPYFRAWIDANENHYTEDVQFCHDANEAGFEVWCDPTIKIGHIGSTVY